MKNTIVTFLVLVIGWSVSQEAFFLLWYQVANASFTERFCVNVKAPDLMCNGKCQMEELTQQKKEEPVKNIPALVLRFSYIALLPGHPILSSISDQPQIDSFHFQWDYDFQAVQPFFHPPPLSYS